MLKVTGDEGRFLSLSRGKVNQLEDVLLTVEFRLPWAIGHIEGWCEQSAVDGLEVALEGLLEEKQEQVNFINPNGNIDLSFAPTRTGQLEIGAVLIPNMQDEDRLEFSFIGILTVAAR